VRKIAERFGVDPGTVFLDGTRAVPSVLCSSVEQSISSIGLEQTVGPLVEVFLPKRKQRAGLQISKLGLLINEKHISAPDRHVALLACLYDNRGRVVPYKRLFSTLGYEGRRDVQKHLLRQYMAWIKRALSQHEAPYVLSVAQNVGYALCELAPE
jgi:hypothetical protein